MFSKTSPWFSIVFTAVMIGNGFVPIAVASEWNFQNGIRGSEARSKDSLRYSGRYPMLLTQGGTNEQAASDLIPFLLDDSAEIREKAFNDLSQLGVDVAVPALTGALQNPDWQVRVISAYSLGRLGSEASAAVPVLINALQDENADVRFSAAQALGEINSDQAVAPLIDALKDPDENVRFAAASALLQMGPKVQGDNLVTFIKFLQDGNPMPVPVYPEFSQADTLTPEAKLGIPMFVAALGTSNWFLREQAVNILSQLKIDSIPALNHVIEIAKSPHFDGYIRSALIESFLKANIELLQKSLKLSNNLEDREKINNILAIFQSNKESETINSPQYDGLQANQVLAILQELEKTDTSDLNAQMDKLDREEELINLLFDKLQNSGTSNISLEKTLTTLKPILLRSSEITHADYTDNNRNLAVECISLFGLDAIPMIIESLPKDDLFPIFLQALASSEYKETQLFSIFILDKIGIEIIPDFVTIESFLVKELESRLVDKQVKSNNNESIKSTELDFTKESESFLVEELESAKESDFLLIIMKALGNLRSDSAITALLKTLQMQNDDMVVITGIEILGETKAQKATPYLIQLLRRSSISDLSSNEDSQNESFIIEVINSLGQTGTISEVPVLIPYLNNPSYSIREATANALGQIRAKETISLLIESLNDPSWNVRLAAADALKNIGSEAIPTLLKVLDSNSQYPVALQAPLSEKNADRRRTAAYVLWLMGGTATSAMDNLTAVMNNGNEHFGVRRMALTATETIKQNFQPYPFPFNVSEIDPKNIIPKQCFEYNKLYDDSDSAFTTVETHQLLYAGRCIHGEYEQKGGRVLEFYSTLKNLLNRRNK